MIAPPRTALTVVADLIFGSKIRGSADAVGVTTVFARGHAALLEAAPAADVILLDLGTRWLKPAMITELKTLTAAPVIAFASHLDTDAIRAARDAGADRVLARSAFVEMLPDLLRG